MLDEPSTPEEHAAPAAEAATPPKKNKGGRPKGSKNKPKDAAPAKKKNSGTVTVTYTGTRPGGVTVAGWKWRPQRVIKGVPQYSPLLQSRVLPAKFADQFRARDDFSVE